MFGSSRAMKTVAGAVALVTIGVSAVALQAGAASSPASSFVAVTPCRLFDFRPGGDNVGPRATPLRANESHKIQVTGNQGKCTGIPTNATGVAMNVTALGATSPTFVAVVPGNQTTEPGTSNLNPQPGAPPTPNKVDVQLGDRAIRVFNKAGSVNLFGDVVGYYLPAGTGGTPGPRGPQGVPGATGAKGATGATGAKGATGATGAKGATGTPGPKGDKGDQGDPGLSEITYVSDTFTTLGARTTASVDCPTDWVAISGGVSGGTTVFTELSRLKDAAGTGWTARVGLTSGADVNFTVTAICANATATSVIIP